MKPVLLALMFLSEEHRAQMAQSFELVYAPDAAQATTAIAEHGARITVVLTIGAAGDAAKTREAVVRPVSVGVASGLIYRQWVADRRAWVERVSGGKLGYVHIADMSDASLE
eukprot:gene19802-39310_t